MIRLAIFEDNDSLRDTLALVFETADDLFVSGQYPNALLGINEVLTTQPDVILMDIDMPGLSGIEAVNRIRQQNGHAKILMLTVFEDVERIFAALSAGAVGYLLKKTPADKIMEAIRVVADGGAAMTPSIALKVLGAFQQPKPTDFRLTSREKDVLQRLVNGDSYKLIAHHCAMSLGTVRTHIVNIYEKLHVNSKAEAVAKALKSGMNT